MFLNLVVSKYTNTEEKKSKLFVRRALCQQNQQEIKFWEYL